MILSAVFALCTKKQLMPEFEDIFSPAALIFFVNVLLIMMLFPKTGCFTMIPCLAAG